MSEPTSSPLSDPAHPTPTSGDTKTQLRWVLLIALLPLIGFWTHGIFDLDEGFYAAVTAEMNWRGEWITPFYQSQPWFEKPILLYWLAKPFLALLGPDFGLRLPGILVSLGLIAYIFRTGESVLGAGKGVLAASILGTTLLWAILSRLMMTDVLLVAALTVAVVEAYRGIAGPRRHGLISGVMIGVGILAKGPVAALLFWPILLGWWLAAKRPKFSIQLLLAHIIATIGIASLWYVHAYLANGDAFVQKFLIEQNLNRFTGGDAAHTWPGWQNLIFYPIVLLVGMMPWSVQSIQSLGRLRKQPLEIGSPSGLFLLAAVIPFAFFTVSGAKLPHYILPCIPFLALFLASRLPHPTGIPTTAKWTAAIIALLTNLALPFYYHLSGHADVHALARYLNDKPGQVVAYQMPRREADRGTGQLKIRETSHPSLEVYVGRPVWNAEELTIQGGQLTASQDGPSRFHYRFIKLTLPAWIITRKSRINPEIAQALNANFITTTKVRGSYELWEIKEKPPMPK